MALKVSKRKRPSREDKPLREVTKIAEKVFDDKTLDVLMNFMNTRKIKSLDYPVASGKEAMVFRAKTQDGSFIAVKIFKYETSSFHKRMAYVEGDPRFNAEKVRHRKRAFVQMWARKEYANLRTCFEAGVSVPEPIAFRENIVLMQFLGVNGVPCALLEDVVLAKPKKVLEELLDAVKKMYSVGLVHADLSSFNVIIMPETEKPVLIDFGQGVSIEHPRAQEFLEKDVGNVLKYFERQAGIKKDFGKTMDFVCGKK